MKHQLTHLFNLNENEFLKTLTQVPNGCISLNLSRNDFGKRSGNLLACIVFPPNLVSLDLSLNHLINKSGARLAQFFAVLPNLTSLDLSKNSLARKSDVQWSFEFNFLDKFSTEIYKLGSELALAFAALPQTLTHLDLRENELNILPLEEMILLKGKLPQISTVNLSYEEMNVMTKKQRQAIRDIFPNIKTIFIYKNEELCEDNEQLYTEENAADLRSISNYSRWNNYCT
ncbi:hypothetical protein [Legionella bozemanae]|uniref:Leucine-rich repeat-containing protein n=1 Tax=Legionella bozemanae TaxID=447 RepID=A0A0W0RTS4_LEGBO|nr:hypothetical protein [Legionella bozemanae]KTC74465.1 leucine-rich repeat-containing protein [Legionella bozemanae]STO32394.1 Ran GTPase-activating protein (RanGAP) involved in mRNA processing and transport [Legionella bozemanae]